MSLQGIYLGVVEKVGDPEGLGRVKVRVPAVYGILGGVVGAVPVDSLPWAIPMGLPAGGSAASGGFSMLPEIGDQVAVQFLDAEPEKPVWSWLMQTTKQAQKLKLHEYLAAQENGQDVPGSSARTILTRYGNSLELKSEVLTLTTREGQQVLLQTSQSAAGGVASLQTPKGQSVNISDLAESVVVQALQAAVISGAKVMINAPTSILAKTERCTIMAGASIITVQGNSIAITTGSGASVVIDDNGNVAVSSAGGAALSLENAQVQLGDPTGAGVVLGNGQLSITAAQCTVNAAAFTVGVGAASIELLTHTHTNGNDGSPTGPPIPMP